MSRHVGLIIYNTISENTFSSSFIQNLSKTLFYFEIDDKKGNDGLKGIVESEINRTLKRACNESHNKSESKDEYLLRVFAPVKNALFELSKENRLRNNSINDFLNVLKIIDFLTRNK